MHADLETFGNYEQMFDIVFVVVFSCFSIIYAHNLTFKKSFFTSIMFISKNLNKILLSIELFGPNS